MQSEFERTEKDKLDQLLKEKTEAQHEAELHRERIIQWIIVSLLIIAVIISAWVFRSYRQKKLANRIISEQKALVEEKHREITDSINYSERIQRSFLATEELLSAHLKEYFVLFRPKDVVSGDFYWGATVPDNKFVLVVADSTGHGVPGAIMSILNISTLEGAVKEGRAEPAAILNYTRSEIIARLKKDGSPDGGKDGMDCCLIVLNKERSELSYAAANNPLWIVRNNALLEFAPDKMPVGKHEKDQRPFTQHAIPLQPGDAVYLFTDGMTDQFGGPKGKKFMHKRLKELLISVAQIPMADQLKRMEETLAQWKGQQEQVDDILVIGFRV